MPLKPFNILSAFFWSIFMGVTVLSIGIGAAYPSVNLIARPFVCLIPKSQIGD